MSRITRTIILGLLVTFAVSDTTSAMAPVKEWHHRERHHRGKKIARKAGWAGAGFAAGQALGPAGSAAVGTAKYRRDLKAGGHRSRRAAVKIGAPIAAGAIAGPPGVAGYAAYSNRHWIKRHILHRHRSKH